MIIDKEKWLEAAPNSAECSRQECQRIADAFEKFTTFPFGYDNDGNIYRASIARLKYDEIDEFITNVKGSSVLHMVFVAPNPISDREEITVRYLKMVK